MTPPAQPSWRRVSGRRVTALAGLLCSGLLSAQPPLEEVRVTGTRNLLAQDLFLDGSIQRITFADQVSLNRTAADWIERLPGVSLNGQGGLFQSYSIRGFSRWRVRTEVDGVPIMTDRRAGNSASFLPPEFLRHAEVIRGPGSSLYGSGAMGGVVSLETGAPEGLHLAAGARGNDNGVSTTVSYGQAQGVSGALNLRHADNATDARGSELNTGYEQAALALKANHQLNDLTLTANWLPSYGRDIGKSSGDYPGRAVSDYPKEVHSISSIQIANSARWLARFYHHYQDWESRTERVGVRTDETEYEGHTFGGLFYAATSYLSGIGRYGLEWVGRRDVTVSAREFDLQDQLVFDARQIDGDQDDLGAFVEHQWQLGMLRLGGGLRYDYVQQSSRDRERTDEELNASASADWLVEDRWVLSARLSTGFRFPTLTELYFDGTTPRGRTLGNPELTPERSVATQLGAEFTDERLSVSLHTYYNDLDNYIERYQVAEDLRSYRNLNDADIWGFEAQLRWQSGAHWDHSLSYQWQRGEDGDGEWLADLNPNSWRWLMTWRRAQVELQNDLVYRASRRDRGEGEQPLGSALVWNVRLAYRWQQQWQGEVYVSNLLDRQYLGSADEDAAYQPGRTVGFRISWSRQ